MEVEMVRAQLDVAYSEYCNKVRAIGSEVQQAMRPVLGRSRLQFHSGMGVWVFSKISTGKNVYVGDMENPPAALVELDEILEIPVEGYDGQSFGSTI